MSIYHNKIYIFNVITSWIKDKTLLHLDIGKSTTIQDTVHYI